MKEKLEKLTALLAEEQKMSTLDLVLSLLVTLLSGIILGFLFCPRRQKVSYMGCNNGNNYWADDDCDCEDCACADCDEERCCGEREFCGNDRVCCEEGPEEVPEEKGKKQGDAPVKSDEKGYVKIR